MTRLPLLLLIAVLALTAQSLPRPANAVFEMKICEYCRRNWDDSPCRIRGNFDANGKSRTVHVCSPFCLAAVMKRKPHYKTTSTQIVPWESRAEVAPPMLNAT